MEVGPYRVTKDNALTLNNGTWNEFANLLFVDNPVGTGFSYVDTNSYIHGLNAMATQFITFLEKFFALFPEFESDDVSIFREMCFAVAAPLTCRTALHCWRVIRRTAYSLYCESHPRSQQVKISR